MDESDTTQVMPEAPDPLPVDAASAGKPPRMRWWIIAAVVAVVIAATAGGVYLAGRGGEEAPETDLVAESEVASVETVSVPDLRGMTLERATQDIEAAGLTVGSIATAVVEQSVAPAGTVFSQDPLPGEEVAPGTAVAVVMAEAPTVTPPAESPSTGGSSSGGSAAAEPPPAPEDVEIGDLNLLPVKPIAIDPGVLVLQPQWTTVLEHTDAALEWTSGPVTLGSGEKRIILDADGPNGFLVGVHSWGPGQTDWKLRSLIVSQPGVNPYETELDVPAGVHTFRVKSLDTSVLWKITVQEKK